MSGLTVKGLKKEMEYVEDIIEIKKGLGRDCSFEKNLLKEWRKYLAGGSLHYKLCQNATKSKSEALQRSCEEIYTDSWTRGENGKIICHTEATNTNTQYQS